MSSEPTVTKQEIRKSLIELLKKTEASIIAMQVQEAKGKAKLEKGNTAVEVPGNPGHYDTLKKDALAGAAAPPAASAMCLSCTGANLEPLGNHMGMDHFICKDCGEVGSTIAEQNQQAEQEAVAEGQTGVVPPVAKAEVSPEKGHPLKGYVPKQEAPIKPLPVDFKTNAEVKGVAKAELPAAKVPTVNSVKQAVGVTGSAKVPAAAKKLSIPTTGATAPKTDAFNTGGANPASAAMSKEALPMQDVDTEDGKARPGTVMPKAGKVVKAPGSGGDVKEGSLRKDAAPVALPQSAAASPAVPMPSTKRPNPYDVRTNPININQPPEPRRYDPVDPLTPTVRQVGNEKLAQAAGPAKATSVATVRQRWNAKTNGALQQTRRNGFFAATRDNKVANQMADVDPPKQVKKPAPQAPAPVAKAEGIPSAPKAPKAPGAAETTSTQAPVVPTVKNPNVTPTGTPDKKL